MTFTDTTADVPDDQPAKAAPPAKVVVPANDLTDFDAIQGIAIHRAIGALLAARPTWTPTPTLSDVAVAARVGCGTGTVGTAKERAFRQGVTTAVGVYARRFVLGPDWSFEGAEVKTSGSRFDLVWQHTDGRVLVDEIKRGASRVNHTEAAAQVRRYLKAGHELFGSGFVGVRLLWLSAPLSSQIYVAGKSYGKPLSTVPELVGGDR